MLASIKEHSLTDTTKFSKTFLETVNKYSERQHNIESWLKRFPTMSSKDYANALDHIKQTIKENIDENKRLLAAQKASIKARKAEAKALVASKKAELKNKRS